MQLICVVAFQENDKFLEPVVVRQQSLSTNSEEKQKVEEQRMRSTYNCLIDVTFVV